MTSSPSTKSKKSFFAVTTALFLLFTVVIAGSYINNKNRAIRRAEQPEHPDAEKEKKKEELQSLFDNYLNNFKNELREKATDYKNTRVIFNDIKSPYNFETPEYAKENYNLFKNSIAPSLRQKASEIIDVFDNYNKKIEANLKDQNNDLQQTFLKKWREMNKNQLTKYVAFFSKEEELIQAYDNLITFYYVHSRLYEVDVKINQFTFSRKEDEKKATELLNRIDTLQNSSRKQK